MYRHGFKRTSAYYATLCFITFLMQTAVALTTPSLRDADIPERTDEKKSFTLMATTEKDEPSMESIQILSLEWKSEQDFAKSVCDLWRWKDAALGDGRDFFVPKPKTLSALQELILSTTTMLEECTVLSNCARFEIICVTKNPSDDPRNEISRIFASQLKASSMKGNPSHILSLLPQIMNMDTPDQSIISDAPEVPSTDDTVAELESSWQRIVGVRGVCKHLCLVAAGLASRPKRLDREVAFRPFSSRDAHIMLQLKRTKDIAAGRYCNQLLESSIRAGKGARSVNVVPDIEKLRSFGSGNSKYSVDPPKHLLLEVSKAAEELAIDPIVSECAAKILSGQYSERIQELRMTCESFASTSDELTLVRSHLHAPTMRLREGQMTLADIQAVVKTIQKEVEESRFIHD